MSKRIDEIASQASAADHSILLVLTDLQARTWEAWQRLSAVTQGLFIEAAVAGSADAQVEQSIELYRKYKERSK
jgi:hypothetical protein